MKSYVYDRVVERVWIRVCSCSVEPFYIQIRDATCPKLFDKVYGATWKLVYNEVVGLFVNDVYDLIIKTNHK